MYREMAICVFHSALVALAVLLLAPAASATTGVLWVWGNTTLTEDHAGIVVLADDNARLDCDGHTIYEGGQGLAACGPNSDETCGIYAVGVSSPYVIDCTVQSFDIGMYISGSFYPTVRNSMFKWNNDGLHVEYTTGSTGTFLLNNTFRDNDDEGLVCRYSNKLRLINNDVWYNDSDGIDADHCDELYISGSYHSDNGRNGLELDYCDDVTIRNSRFNSNGVGTGDHSGLSLDESNDANIYLNDFFDNAKSGIRLTANSDGGTIHDNRGSGNGDNDAYQSSNSSNTWSDNDFDNPSPSWLD